MRRVARTEFRLWPVLLMLAMLLSLATPHARLAVAQGEPVDEAADCLPEVEPNDQPVDALVLPDVAVCVAGDNQGADQDLVTWTVDEAAAVRRWSIEATGVPGHTVLLEVYWVTFDDAGTVVSAEKLL